jgi:hypothetical protein
VAPSHALAFREGAAKRWTGVRAGQAIEPRNQEFGVPTSLARPEGNIAGGATREPSGDPARSENQGMCGIFMRENREIPCLSVPLIRGRVAQGTLRRYA